MTLPLDGVRVLEVASWTFVPAGAAVLADLGADVIKIEPPSGDPQRGLRNPLNRGNAGPNPFVEIPNRGKRSATLDLRTSGGLDLLLRLASSADVFLTSHLPGRCTELGIDVDDLRAANPQIIYVRGSGWGAHGPMANVGSFDVAAAWAACGLADRFDSGPDGPPSQPPAFFDLQGSSWIAGAVTAALFRRARTGEPSIVDVALMNVAMWAVAPDIVGAAFVDEPWVRTRHEPENPLSNWYPTSDGRWVFLVMLQPDRFWRELCAVLDRADLVDDPRFVDALERHRHRSACAAELEATFASRSLGEWTERLRGFSGAWAPALTFHEVRDHPQVAANGFLVSIQDGREGAPYDVVASPVHFDRTAPVPTSSAPEVGQDTELVLLEAGLDWDEVTEARDRGWLG